MKNWLIIFEKENQRASEYNVNYAVERYCGIVKINSKKKTYLFNFNVYI